MFNFEEIRHAKIIPKKGNFILAGDLGGTHSNFAIFQEKGLKLLASVHFKSQDITNFVEIVRLVIGIFNKEYGIKNITTACFAAACPIHESGLYCSLTNTKWDVDLKKIKRKTKLPYLALINDFEAIAYGIDIVPKNNLININRGKKFKKKPIVLLGAGTGLGKSILTWDKKTKRYLSLKSEGGHGDLVINSKEEFKFLENLKREKKLDNVSWEDVLSGKGLTNIYKHLYKKHKTTIYTKKIVKNYFDPMIISKYHKKDPACKETFKWFTKFYGRCAKSLALDAMAQGGVYIGGGIAAKNYDNFKWKEFKQEFMNSKKQRKLLQKIPVYAIKNYDVSLYGSAAAALLHKRGVI